MSTSESGSAAATDLRERLRDAGAVNISMTRVADGRYAFDFDLPFAVDAPFSSSLEYDTGEFEVTSAALRFPQTLLDDYDDADLREEMDALLEASDPPDGALWSTYIRGDARETGPHILAPGGMTAVVGAAFANYVGRVIDAYHDIFDTRPGTPTGISDDAYDEGRRVMQKLVDGGAEDVDAWWSWEGRDDYSLDFKIPAGGPHTSQRTAGASVLTVRGGDLGRLVLRLPRMDDDKYSAEEVGVVSRRVMDDTGVAGYTDWRRGEGYSGSEHAPHIESREGADVPAMRVARQVAQVPEAFVDAVFDVL